MLSYILSNEPRAETEQRIVALLEDGRRIDGYVKGARKMTSRMRAGVLPYTVSELTLVPGRALWVVRGAMPQETFPAFQGQLFMRAGVQVMGEMMATLYSGNPPKPESFVDIVKMTRTLHAFAGLNLSSAAQLRWFASVWLRTLAHGGLAPVFASCAACGAEAENNVLSPQAGGMLCPGCAGDNEAQALTFSSRGAQELRSHHIPSAEADLRTFFTFFLAFMEYQVPQMRSSLRWVISCGIKEAGLSYNEYRYDTDS